MAFFPGDTVTVRWDDIRANDKTKVFDGVDIVFDVYNGDDVVETGVGIQEGDTNNWLVIFDVPDDTVGPVSLKVESVASREGASRTSIVFVPVGAV